MFSIACWLADCPWFCIDLSVQLEDQESLEGVLEALCALAGDKDASGAKSEEVVEVKIYLNCILSLIKSNLQQRGHSAIE